MNSPYMYIISTNTRIDVLVFSRHNAANQNIWDGQITVTVHKKVTTTTYKFSSGFLSDLYGMPSKKEPEDPAVVTEALNSSVLTDMVNNLEATKLKLLLEIKELKEKLEQQKEDQSDIYYYLNKKCDESFEVIASLEEQILNEQADREIAEKLYETKIEDLKASSASNELKLNSKISDLENRLEMLNAFSETKDETEQNLKNLMTKLEEERVQFSINAESMENKFLMEREKLRKSYDVKYENIKKELEQSVDGKLTKKTKKTQIMNIIMKKELDSQVLQLLSLFND